MQSAMAYSFAELQLSSVEGGFPSRANHKGGSDARKSGKASSWGMSSLYNILMRGFGQQRLDVAA